MEGRGRRPRRRVLRPEVERFVDGVTSLSNAAVREGTASVVTPGRPDIVIPPERVLPPIFVPRPSEVSPDLIVDVIRPTDLVAMRVEAFGLSLVSGATPVLRAGDDGGHLVVHLAFQHMTERAIYEGLTNPEPPLPPPDDPPPDPLDARHSPPELALAANASRLVFEVAPELEISYSSEGILAAVATLPMAVHPLAAPRPIRRGLPDLGLGLTLGPDVVAVATDAGLLVGNATRARPASSTAATRGLNEVMRDRRIARAITARLGAVGVAGLSLDAAATRTPGIRVGGREFVVGPVGGPGGLLGPDVEIGRMRRPKLSREPRQFETAIEAPFRLIVSPSEHGGWAHANTPVGADGDQSRVELWHTRLGVRQTDRQRRRPGQRDHDVPAHHPGRLGT
jgi:hypothetical protein